MRHKSDSRRIAELEAENSALVMFTWMALDGWEIDDCGYWRPPGGQYWYPPSEAMHRYWDEHRGGGRHGED